MDIDIGVVTKRIEELKTGLDRRVAELMQSDPILIQQRAVIGELENLIEVSQQDNTTRDKK